tara:strand:+ start:647 stop:826 length:180 start_codon:yes stop_codon:yes gene_type:complete
MIDPRLVTIDEACERLSISRSTFYSLRNDGSIKVKKIGSKPLIPIDEITRYINQLEDAD